MPFTLPDKVYDVIKWLLIVVVPAFGTLYGVLADELGLGHTESVLKILFAVAAFLGIILGISNAVYNNSDEKYDGTIDPYYADAITSPAALDVKKPLEKQEKREVLLKVEPQLSAEEIRANIESENPDPLKE